MAQPPIQKASLILSLLATALTAISALVGLFWTGLYRNQPGDVMTEAKAWHLVTVVIALPLAAYAIAAARRGVTRGRVALVGVLAYYVYTWLEFAVSPPFTALYLVYVTGYGTALVGLVAVVATTDLEALARSFPPAFPRRLVAGFCFGFAAVLMALWLKDIGGRMLAGSYGWPASSEAVKHVVQALDLGLLVPLGLSGGVLLLRRAAAGYLLGGIAMIKLVTMGTAVVAMIGFDALAGHPVGWPQAVLFVLVWVIGLYVAARFFAAIDEK